MDVFDYIGDQSHRAAAALTTSYLDMNPTARAVTDEALAVAKTLGTAVPLVRAGANLLGHDLESLNHLTEAGHVGHELGSIAADVAERTAQVAELAERPAEAVAEVAENFPAGVGKEQENPIAQTVAQGQADEAQRKYQEVRQQDQDKAALDKPAQEQTKEGPQVDQIKDAFNQMARDPRLDAQEVEHNEKFAQLNKDIADRLNKLEEKHVGDPALPELRDKFNAVAADQRAKLTEQQTAERTQLQNQVFAEQNRVQPVQPTQPTQPQQAINDPTRFR